MQLIVLILNITGKINLIIFWKFEAACQNANDIVLNYPCLIVFIKHKYGQFSYLIYMIKCMANRYEYIASD